MNEPTRNDIDCAVRHGLWLRGIQEPIAASDRMVADLAEEVMRLRAALQAIADLDYRGNRSPESQMAFEALKGTP